MIEPSQCYRPYGDTLASTIIDGDAVLVNLSSGVYYSLDDSAGTVWQMIEQRRSVEQIAECLSARYEATPAQVLTDVRTLMANLLEQKLILNSEPSGAGPEPVDDRFAGPRRPYRAPELKVYTDMSDLLALDPPMPGLLNSPDVERK